MTWVLILSMVGGGFYSDTPVAVTAVDGFTSRDSCLVAANAWLKKTRRDASNSVVRISALCVSKDGG